jgi:hypothetical protein
MRLILTVCSNGDLHEHDYARLLVGENRYYTVKLEAGGLLFDDPSPEFVQEFIETLGIEYTIGISYGVCDCCLEIINQSQDLIHEVGGR